MIRKCKTCGAYVEARGHYCLGIVSNLEPIKKLETFPCSENPMHLDQYGLPQQNDGDVEDQLQRIGMIIVAETLTLKNLSKLGRTCAFAIMKSGRLTAGRGIYKRHSSGDPRNVSADQLISALGALVVLRWREEILDLFVATYRRLGFAQNFRRIHDNSEHWKIPDFLLIRALPLFARAHWALYPLAVVVDVLLLPLAIGVILPVWRDDKLIPVKRTPDEVDDNNTILTLAVCRARMPTPLSYFAAKLFARIRPWNYGCASETAARGPVETANQFAWDPVNGALRWYHRKENGGNPQIAILWHPVVARYLK